MKKTVIKIFVALIMTVLALSVFTGCFGFMTDPGHSAVTGERNDEKNTEEPLDVPVKDVSTSFKRGSAEGDTYSVVDIYRNNVNSVVGIRSESKSQNIFGQTSVNASSGTGIILTADGYILTNNHIIDEGTTFKVTLYNGNTYDAVIVGAEKSNDVAVLKIEAEGLQPAIFGNTAEVVVGEDVIVVGNPLGELAFSLSRGVVSALNRAINEDGTPIIVFQIDAAVNEGNSGGPAFDARGHVIGMVTAKVKSNLVEGIGFCIPINDALSIASQLIQFGYVKGKGALGIAAAVAYRQSYFGSSRVSGAYVNHVIPGSAADNAGLEVGMLITEVDSTEITTPEELNVVIRGKPAGTTVEVKGVFNNREFTATVTLDEYSPDMVPENWDTKDGAIM